MCCYGLRYICARAGPEVKSCFAESVSPFNVILGRNSARRDIVRNRYRLIKSLPPNCIVAGVYYAIVVVVPSDARRKRCADGKVVDGESVVCVCAGEKHGLPVNVKRGFRLDGG